MPAAHTFRLFPLDLWRLLVARFKLRGWAIVGALFKTAWVTALAADYLSHLPTLLPHLIQPRWVFLQSELAGFAVQGALTDAEASCQFLVQGGGVMTTQVVQHVRTPIDAGRVATVFHDAPHLLIKVYSVFRFLIHSFFLFSELIAFRYLFYWDALSDKNLSKSYFKIYQKSFLKQRGVTLYLVDALLSLIKVFLVQFEADEVPMLLDTSDGCGTAAHCSVENHPPLIAVGQHQIANEVNGFLGGVRLVFVAMYGLLDDNRARMFLVLIRRIDTPYLSIAGVFLVMVAVTLRVVSLTAIKGLHLWIVRAELAIEYDDVLVIA